jgi:Trehalose-phosphatase
LKSPHRSRCGITAVYATMHIRVDLSANLNTPQSTTQLTILTQLTLFQQQQVQHVRGQIEVVPVRLHKGVVAKTILRTVLQKGGAYPDFVLCVGDDVSDEHMFTSVYSFLADVDAEGGGADSPTVGDVPLGVLPQGDVSPWGAATGISSSSSSANTGPADELRLYICTVGKKVCVLVW